MNRNPMRFPSMFQDKRYIDVVKECLRDYNIPEDIEPLGAGPYGIRVNLPKGMEYRDDVMGELMAAMRVALFRINDEVVGKRDEAIEHSTNSKFVRNEEVEEFFLHYFID